MHLLEGQNGPYPDSALKSSGQNLEPSTESCTPEPSIIGWNFPGKGAWVSSRAVLVLSGFVYVCCLRCLAFTFLLPCGQLLGLRRSHWPKCCERDLIVQVAVLPSTVKLGFLKPLFLFWVFWKDTRWGILACCNEQDYDSSPRYRKISVCGFQNPKIPRCIRSCVFHSWAQDYSLLSVLNSMVIIKFLCIFHSFVKIRLPLPVLCAPRMVSLCSFLAHGL